MLLRRISLLFSPSITLLIFLPDPFAVKDAHLIVITSSNAPEIRHPSAHNQEHQKDKESHTNPPVPRALLTAVKLVAAAVDNLAISQALLLGPLQSAQINIEEAVREQRRRHNHGAGSKDDVDDDDVVVAVVVAVLDNTSNNTHDDVHTVVDGDLDGVASAEDLLVPHGGADAVDDDGGTEKEGDSVDAERRGGAADRGAPSRETHGQQHAEAADEHQRQAVAEKVDEDADERDEEEAEVLAHGAVPTSGNSVDVEALLGELGGVGGIHDGGAGLEEREEDDAPEGPREPQHLADLELLVLLRQRLARRRVRLAREPPLAPAREEPEDQRGGVGEQVHEDGRPVHPAEVARLLRDDVGRGFAHERADLADAQLEAQRRREAVGRREPGAEDFVLRDLRGDVAERLHHDAEDHEFVVADRRGCCDENGADAVNGIAPEHGT